MLHLPSGKNPFYHEDKDPKSQTGYSRALFSHIAVTIGGEARQSKEIIALSRVGKASQGFSTGCKTLLLEEAQGKRSGENEPASEGILGVNNEL